MYFAHQQLESWRNEINADTWDSGALAPTGGWTLWADIDNNDIPWASAFNAQWRYKIEDVSGLPGDGGAAYYPPRSATIQVDWDE